MRFLYMYLFHQPVATDQTFRMHILEVQPELTPTAQSMELEKSTEQILDL